MCNPFKAIGKVFKSVTKVVKKILPVVLAAAAIYFTAGAALGVAGTAGGWGAAVSSFTSQMGATGVLGQVLTGAITQAGYGAALGAGTSLLTGGDPLKGAATGALTGAVTGGVMGGIGMNTDPLSGIGENAASGSPITVEGLPPAGLDASAVEAGAAEGLWSAPSAVAANPAAAAPAAAPSGGGLLSKGGWLERNQAIVGLGGQAVAGVGQGLIAGAKSEDEAESKLALEREKAARIRANYGNLGPGLLKPEDVAHVQEQAGTRPTPGQRFDPRTYGGRWVYNTESRRVEYVPTGTA
jgi:hypothetical protein